MSCNVQFKDILSHQLFLIQQTRLKIALHPKPSSSDFLVLHTSPRLLISDNKEYAGKKIS